MIYTSYFAQMRNFPVNVTPVAICLGIPSWYKGLTYGKVALDRKILDAWKARQNKALYETYFKKEILGRLTVEGFIADIEELVGKKVAESKTEHVALLCYEKPGDFCHRHLVAEWANLTEWEKPISRGGTPKK